VVSLCSAHSRTFSSSNRVIVTPRLTGHALQTVLAAESCLTRACDQWQSGFLGSVFGSFECGRAFATRFKAALNRSSESSACASRAASRNFWIWDFRFEIAMAVEYIIYCDESESKGRHFSNFYGGALVTSSDLPFVRDTLAKRKTELNLFGEIKWSKITPNYRQKYLDMVDCFFGLIASGKVKMRVMFTQNIVRSRNLTKEHIKNQYAILYYYFIRQELSPNLGDERGQAAAA
jgi:hypothetical protein